ncbi:MAG: hypothetical protein RMY36_029430 [Nostoc sp. SerVER01]|uniref:hypothetical protein n=1 Tax=Nostoc sp. CCY 9925 TaxID=3103865 RepID=UPI002ADA1934|nr:hypothetical protein [Nostoc sp. SerVER01]MDZ8028970.1 hypothetical protein [Nostoc sp. DedQUE11]MDZ8075962.1 hypothetical protein [Nostoc sp. DedQUE01]MDZ8242284.1 hypothetical protein [Nostoc sp. ChiQUE01a]
MSIKRMLASAALILPIVVTFIPSQADAQVRRQFRRPVPVRVIKKPARIRVYTPVQARRRILVPGRWVQTNRGRQWIPARYIYR